MTEFIRKIVMLGDPSVGKTSLVGRFVNNMFSDSYISTLGAKPSKKIIKLKNINITLMIWDIAGHNYNLHPTYYAGAKGGLIVCDVTKRATLDSLEHWQSSLFNTAGKVPISILANKSDLPKREFDLKDMENIGLSAMLTSAKTGENVEKAFTELAGRIVHG